MKKYTQKAFTLVELIVVITILAILATVAFVSLQWYSQDAKNSKVVSDARTLISTIEASLTKWTISLNNIIGSSTKADNTVDTTWTITYKTSTGLTLQTALSNATYDVWTIDFTTLWQNGEDFKDSEWHEYLMAVAYTWATSYYQVVWQVKDAAWNYTSIVKWTYFGQASDLEWLVDGKWVADNWLKDKEIINAANGLY